MPSINLDVVKVVKIVLLLALIVVALAGAVSVLSTVGSGATTAYVTDHPTIFGTGMSHVTSYADWLVGAFNLFVAPAYTDFAGTMVVVQSLMVVLVAMVLIRWIVKVM